MTAKKAKAIEELDLTGVKPDPLERDPMNPSYVHPEHSSIKPLPHGGSCCGMTHIKGFFIKPGQFIGARAGYPKAIPIQTAEERLLTVVKDNERIRAHGIIEIVLVSSERENWHDVLLANKFREVNANKNSNSQNNIYVYHRSSGDVSGN